MTAFLHGQSKIFFFFPKKDIQRTNILRLSNSKAPITKQYLLTSYKVNDVTERAPRDDTYGTGSQVGFYLHFVTKLMLQSCFPVNNEVQTMFTSISIPDKNIRELRNNVDLNPSSN